MRTVGAGTIVGRNGSVFLVVERGHTFMGSPAYGLADLHSGEYLSLDVSDVNLYEILKLAKFEVLAPSAFLYFNPGAY
jgi:hypothetical protein